MIIIFMLSMLGFLIFMRIFQQVSDEFGFSKKIVATISVWMLFIHLLFVIFLHQRPFLLWLFIGISWASLNVLPKFLQIYLLKRLKKQLISLLDQVILSLQVGCSFRKALLRAIESQPSWYRHQFLEIYNAMTLLQGLKSVTKAKFLKILLSEFLEIDRSNSKTIEQVRAFRRQIKTEEDFRRKSGQILHQVRMQALIVTALYVGLLIFVSLNFGFLQNWNLILFTTSLFSTGLIWIFSVGRRMKWKV